MSGAPPPRVPPHNLEAEEAVLGAVLIEGREALPRCVEILKPTDFYKEAHRVAYATMLDLFDKGEPVDILTLQEALRRAGMLDIVGGPAALALLVERGSVAAYVDSYARIIADHAVARELIQAATNIIAESFEATGDARALMDAAEQRVFAVAQRRIQGNAVKASAILAAAFAHIEMLYDKKEHVTGIATGLTKLDDLTAGLQDSDFILIAARPSIGKTAFALAIAQHAGIRLKKKVLVLSLEMSSQQLIIRMLASEGRVDGLAVRTGRLEGQDWHRLTNAAGRVSEAAIYIDDAPGLSVLDVRAKARRVKSEHGLDLLVIDYLQLMRGRDGSDNRQQEISEISRSLKALAKELNVPVVALSQLSRAIETRGDNTPRLSDLRESGALEQDADVVIFLHRPAFYAKDQKDVDPSLLNTAEIIIGKQRNGPTGKIDVSFLSQYARFENLDHVARAEPTEPF